MYELVNTAEKQSIFDRIWMDAWLEKGYDIEVTENPFAQVLIQVNGEYVATIEFKKYADSNIGEFFDFESFPHIRDEEGTVMEIDKLAVREDARGLETLKVVISAIMHFADDFDVPLLIALIEPRFFQTLRRHYRKDVQKLGESFPYKGDDVIPFSFHTGNLLKREGQTQWIVERV